MKLNIPTYDYPSDIRGSMLLDHLIQDGCVLLKKFDIDETNLSSTRALFTSLCESIGDPISHDAKGTIVWDIQSRTSGTNKKDGVVTYSEHNHEADLHTDSQYSEYPEDYFALLTVCPASCGGGQSYVLTLDDLLEDLNSNAQGKSAIEVLSNTSFPFIIPHVFKLNSHQDSQEYNFGPILREDEIRFRVDTIQKAIELNPDFCTNDQIEAFDFLVSTIRSTAKTQKFHLDVGDLLLVNNKTILHGRSSFSDDRRHLLRVRMNKKVDA